MNEEYGIEQLEKSVVVVCGIINAVDNALEDKHVSIGEGIGIGVKTIPLIGVIRNLPEAKNEFKDMDPGEREKLNNLVQQEFDLRNDVAEQYVEQALGAILQLSTGLINRHNSD